MLHATSVVGIQTTGESNGVLVFVVLAVGTALTLLGLGLVQAATARALVEIDGGRPIGPLGAYRLALDCVRPLFGALLIAAVVVSLLATSLFLFPIAVWLAVRWALVAPATELERRTALGALRRSGRLVRGGWLKVGVPDRRRRALVLVAGPLVGVLLILVTDAPFWLVNIVAGVVYAVTCRSSPSRRRTSTSTCGSGTSCARARARRAARRGGPFARTLELAMKEVDRAMPILRVLGDDVVEALELLNVPSYLIDAAGIVRWLNPAAKTPSAMRPAASSPRSSSPDDTGRARELFAGKVVGASG